MFETQRLINCDFDMLKKVGWLVYNREDQNGGLSSNELDELLKIVTVEGMEKEYQQGYSEGFDDAVCGESGKGY